MVDLVAEDQEGHFGELLELEELVESVFRLRETVDVFGVYEVDYSVDFGEVLFEEGGALVRVGEREGRGVDVVGGRGVRREGWCFAL